MPEDAAKEVTVFEVQEQIATAKVTGWGGTDYMCLAKYKDEWMIVNILWRTRPAQSNRLADMAKLGSPALLPIKIESGDSQANWTEESSFSQAESVSNHSAFLTIFNPGTLISLSK